MSEEKKYSAAQAAVMVLKKAEEILKKSELLKADIHEKQALASDSAFEVKGANSKSSDDARLAEQTPPADNPKEQAEGNNKEWGTAPETYGTLKLAKFIGHISEKRKNRKIVE